MEQRKDYHVDIPMTKKPGGFGASLARPVEKPHDSRKTILRLWHYLSVYKFMLLCAFVCVVVNSVSTLLATYMIRPIINSIVDNDGIESIMHELLIMAFIYIITFLTQFFQTRIMLEIAQKALKNIRNDLFSRLQKLPLSYFDTSNIGNLISHFTNDVDVISQMLSTTCVQILSAIITLITTVFIMLYTNWKLAVIVIVIIPFFVLFTRIISKKSRRFFIGRQNALGNLNGYIEESISGQKVVQVFNHEEQCIKDFDKLNKEYAKKSFSAQFISGTMGPVMGGLSQLNYTITAFFGGLLCIFNGFDIGGLTIFINLSRKFTKPINEITMQVNTIFCALAGAERVFKIMDEEPEVYVYKSISNNTEGCIKINGNIEFKNVYFGYSQDVNILKNINLSVKSGQKVAFVGSTGAGKTTITNLLNRFYDINRGLITIDGKDIKEYDKGFLRDNVAMVLQDTHLFSGTVMENIRYGRLDASDADVISAAKTSNAHEFIIRLENGYNTVIDGDGSNLSQGQRQLLNIARAAISKAPILVLDEATSSIDTRTEKHIEQALDRLMNTRTTFVIAHRLSTVRNSDIIMVLENGEIIERGSHKELLDLKGRYYDLYMGIAKLA